MSCCTTQPYKESEIDERVKSLLLFLLYVRSGPLTVMAAVFKSLSRRENVRAMSSLEQTIRAVRMRLKQSLSTAQCRLTGRRYYCSALAGTSDYNVSINCDMSVSCNCQDDGGAGRLGSLETQGLDEIFSGPTAMAFRKALAEGRMPINTCAGCGELRRIPAASAIGRASQFHVPARGIMVENTMACNLQCLGCNRRSVARTRSKTSLSLDDVRKISSTINRHKIETLYYFKYGEPFLSPTVLDELRVIREENPALRIVVSTNGMILDTNTRREAAMLTDLIYFSVDGMSDATVSRYQRGGSFQKAYDNMRALVAHRNRTGGRRPEIEWKYVLFNWNDRPSMIRTAVDMARSAGVDAISFWPTTVPYYGISWRYRILPFFKTLGVPSWKGREVRIDIGP